MWFYLCDKWLPFVVLQFCKKEAEITGGRGHLGKVSEGELHSKVKRKSQRNGLKRGTHWWWRRRWECKDTWTTKAFRRKLTEEAKGKYMWGILLAEAEPETIVGKNEWKAKTRKEQEDLREEHSGQVKKTEHWTIAVPLLSSDHIIHCPETWCPQEGIGHNSDLASWDVGI